MSADEMGTIKKFIVLVANLLILLLIILRKVEEMQQAYKEYDDTKSETE
jgi:hypothetical protein